MSESSDKFVLYAIKKSPFVVQPDCTTLRSFALSKKESFGVPSQIGCVDNLHTKSNLMGEMMKHSGK
jgi:hypothetical protein